jgi:hypothetical protein
MPFCIQCPAELPHAWLTVIVSRLSADREVVCPSGLSTACSTAARLFLYKDIKVYTNSTRVAAPTVLCMFPVAMARTYAALSKMSVWQLLGFRTLLHTITDRKDI